MEYKIVAPVLPKLREIAYIKNVSNQLYLYLLKETNKEERDDAIRGST